MEMTIYIVWIRERYEASRMAGLYVGPTAAADAQARCEVVAAEVVASQDPDAWVEVEEVRPGAHTVYIFGRGEV